VLPRWPAKAVIVDGNMIRSAYNGAVKRLISAAATADVGGGGFRAHLHRLLALIDNTTRASLRRHVVSTMRRSLPAPSNRRDHIAFTAFACISVDIAVLLGAEFVLTVGLLAKRFHALTADMTVADFMNTVKQIQNYPT